MITLKNIATAATNKKTYERGMEYYNQRRVLKLNAKENDGNKTNISSEVMGSKYSYEVEVTLDSDGDIADHFCDCPAFYSYEGCCKHVVATLLQYYYRKVTEVAPSQSIRIKSQTDNSARVMIQRYSDRAIGNAVALASAEKIRLEPTIVFDLYGRLNLNLSVGSQRMYIVKDIQKFYYDFMQCNMVEYGAKLKFLHNENMLDDDSKRLLGFVMEKIRENSAYMGSMNYYKQDRRNLFLSPSSFDEFFSLNTGRIVEINLKSNYGQSQSKKLLFTDGNPHIEMALVNNDGSFALNLATQPDILIMGARQQYLAFGDKLHRCTVSCTDATGTLLQSFMEKSGTLTIGSADMGSFCTNVLSEIKSYITVDAEDEAIAAYTPEPLIARLYLDMPEQGLITANLYYCYGNEKIDALLKDDISNKTKSIQRSLKDEVAVQTVISQYFDAYDPEKRMLFIDNDDHIYRLLTEGLDTLGGLAEIYTTDKFKGISVRRPPQVNIGVRLRSDLIDISIDTEDFPSDELSALLSSYRQHKKYHKLRDGSFVGLENSPLADISQLADGLDLSDKELASGGATVPKYRALYLDGVIKDSAQIKSDRDSGFKAMVRDIKDVGDSDIEPPESLRQILRNYQKTGFRWLKTMSRYGFGGVLADDMGLGKTLEAIAFLLSHKEESSEHSVSLIVCPASLVLNWESEIGRFAPQLSSVCIIGDAQQRESLIKEIPNYDIAITSYDLLKRDIELYNEFKFYCLIIDEAQYIKNAVTLNARSVKSINSAQRFALTGTPVENSLAEIWSIFDFLMPGYLHAHSRFKQDYEQPIIKDGDKAALENLKRMLTPFILRRLKSNVLKELPPKTESVLYAPLEGEQKKLYTANLATIRQQLGAKIKQSGLSSNKVIILAMLTRLRQICCDPSLCYEDYSGESAKLELCLDLLESSVEAGHKVLLFSQFTSMLSIIESKLRERHIKYYLLKGSTPKDERADLTTRFNTDSTPIFLISLKAGGTGLNLTGADIVIHYDPWWNVSAQNQATDRAHRIGQQNSVQVYKLIAKDTIEEKIIKLQQQKLKLADSVISEGDGVISTMTQDEIMALFDA